MIKLENISQVFGYGDSTKIALRAIDLEIKKGDFVALMGGEGSGKSSLLNILGLLARPATGTHLFLDQEINYGSTLKRAQLRRYEIGFIFQNFNLLPHLNILDNISLPLAYAKRKMSHSAREALIKKLLSRLGVYDKESLLPHQLNDTQKQLVAIIRAIINRPRLILADEPTGKLDSQSQAIIMDIIKNIHNQDNAIVLATHNPALTKYANRVICLHDGKIRIDQRLKKGQQVDIHKIQRLIARQNQKINQTDKLRKDLEEEEKIPAILKKKKS